MSVLFTPFQVGALGLANRVVIAPMCQYSAVSGCMTDWHLIHLGHLALSGAALLIIEATAVLPEGQITYADVGLWNERRKPRLPGHWRASGAGPTCGSPFNWQMPGYGSDAPRPRGTRDRRPGLITTRRRGRVVTN
jgi:2,4-dienoyl-CoA reductase-like NADH-dependent reductase (Old Yellow Enzyme family)